MQKISEAQISKIQLEIQLESIKESNSMEVNEMQQRISNFQRNLQEINIENLQSINKKFTFLSFFSST